MHISFRSVQVRQVGRSSVHFTCGRPTRHAWRQPGAETRESARDDETYLAGLAVAAPRPRLVMRSLRVVGLVGLAAVHFCYWHIEDDNDDLFLFIRGSCWIPNYGTWPNLLGRGRFMSMPVRCRMRRARGPLLVTLMTVVGCAPNDAQLGCAAAVSDVWLGSACS